MDKTVTTFRKNTQEEVRAGIGEFKGKLYASVRVYIENDVGEYVPTRKGLTLPVGLLPELARCVELLCKEAINDKLVEPERFEGERGK